MYTNPWGYLCIFNLCNEKVFYEKKGSKIPLSLDGGQCGLLFGKVDDGTTS